MVSQLQIDNSHSDLIFTCRKTDTGEFLCALNYVKYLNHVCTFEWYFGNPVETHSPIDLRCVLGDSDVVLLFA